MKRLSICLPALALAMVLFLSSSTPKSVSIAPISPAAAQIAVKAAAMKSSNKVYMYYWYVPKPTDTFIDWKSYADEQEEWIDILNAYCDTNPSGGTLVAVGYMAGNYPHIMYPAIYLYAHM